MRRTKILVVDDEKDHADVLVEALHRQGSAVAAYSADDALRQIDRRRFDLVIADEAIPAPIQRQVERPIPGLCACSYIRFPGLPIIKRPGHERIDAEIFRPSVADGYPG